MPRVDNKKNNTETNLKNTGSPEFQITVFTQRIMRLTEHVNTNKHDYTSKLCLQKTVNKRKKMLKYLKKKSQDRFNKIILAIKNKEIK